MTNERTIDLNNISDEDDTKLTIAVCALFSLNPKEADSFIDFIFKLTKGKI